MTLAQCEHDFTDFHEPLSLILSGNYWKRRQGLRAESGIDLFHFISWDNIHFHCIT